jgi:hypothetical protein
MKIANEYCRLKKIVFFWYPTVVADIAFVASHSCTFSNSPEPEAALLYGKIVAYKKKKG